MAKEKDTNPTGRGMSVEEVVDHGTPTQKAYKVLMEYRDLKFESSTPRISEEEVTRIVESMSPTDNYLYQAYKLYHRTYAEMVMRIELLKEHYDKCCETLKGMYINIDVEEKTLSVVYNHLPPGTRDLLLSSPDIDLVVDNHEGKKRLRFKAEAEGWWTEVKKVQVETHEALNDMVHYYHALDMFDKEYAKMYKGMKLEELKLFRPRIVKSTIREAKQDQVGKDLPGVSRKVLHDKMARGEDVDEIEKRRALVPYWQEIKVNKMEVEWWYHNVIRALYSIIKKAFS